MPANMCVESHLRDLLEQGFEAAVAKDATAGPRHPEWGNGCTAALINFVFLAHAVLSTDEVMKAMGWRKPVIGSQGTGQRWSAGILQGLGELRSN